MADWFTIDKIDDTTYIISEYRHPEETHCYLLIGSELGIVKHVIAQVEDGEGVD